MSLSVALGVYFICWWLVLFMVLPFGVRMPGEDEHIPGHAESAPVQPRILLKFAVTTAISALLFAIVYIVIVYRLLPLDLARS
jgi:predicted secreted protein